MDFNFSSLVNLVKQTTAFPATRLSLQDKCSQKK